VKGQKGELLRALLHYREKASLLWPLGDTRRNVCQLCNESREKESANDLQLSLWVDKGGMLVGGGSSLF